MKITQHGNLVQLTRFGAFNSYVVIEDDSLTLVDTNFAGSAQGILRASAQYQKPIRRIVLTHAHNDHVASLDGLYAQLPEVEIIISEREAPLLAGALTLLPGEPVDKLRGGYFTPKTKPTRTVKEGEQIGSLQVIAAPGHTPGHLALLDTRDNALIAGDAYGTQFRTIVSGMLVWRFPFSAIATWHKPTALATAQKLRALNPSLLAVGHGRMVENPLAEMDRAIAEAQRSFGITADAISSTG